MKKTPLVTLALSVFLPPLGIVMIAVMGVVYFQVVLDSIMGSYAENLAESVATRIDEGKNNPPGYQDLVPYYNNAPAFGQSGAPSRLQGIFAVLDRNGAFLYGSPTIRRILPFMKDNLPLGMARQVYNDTNAKFTVAVFPAASGRYFVVGAVPWSALRGADVFAGYLWPILVGMLGVWGVYSVWRMWKTVVIPLRDLEYDVSTLKWGEQIPKENDPSAIFELQKLRYAFAHLAREAIEKLFLMKRCASDIVRVQEEERAQLSREIHDGPLQDVTALIQRIHLTRTEREDMERAKRQLEIAEQIALDTVREMRSICDYLNPPWLELGFPQAITELTERQSKQYGVKIVLDVDDELELPDNVTLAFFRVSQEAITNSVRHGEAKTIWITATDSGEHWELEIHDDGVGFDIKGMAVSERRVTGHRGLSNMEERMEMIGGSCYVASTPGEGTYILCTMKKELSAFAESM